MIVTSWFQWRSEGAEGADRPAPAGGGKNGGDYGKKGGVNGKNRCGIIVIIVIIIAPAILTRRNMNSWSHYKGAACQTIWDSHWVE